jgi:MinD superfamily P-loop ATPase
VTEIVVLSGKGGTGKTSLTAAFAALAGRTVLTDCDVDAADLHMVVTPTESESHEFRSGATARVVPERCRRCGLCARLCEFDAIARPNESWEVDPLACEGCGVCAHFCPHDAIEMEEVVRGHWYRSETRFGPMLHAQLGVGAENSGKLVTLLRREARAIAETLGVATMLTDGPPGIGCPVIASLSGAEHVVFVTEPTVTGIHDLERVAELAAGFRVKGSIVINKADLDEEKAEDIRQFARGHRLTILGDVPYTAAFTQAQMAGRTVVEADDGPAAQAVRALWARLREVVAAQSPRLQVVPVHSQAY